MADYKDQVQELLSMGIGLMQRENYKEAKKVFTEAITADPGNYDAYIHLGNACANLEETEDAVLAFSNALAIRPDSGEAMFSIGNVYYLQGDTRKANKYYNKTEAMGYTPVDMYLIMADLFDKAEDNEQVLRCLNRALKIAPLRGDIWRQKVVVQIQMGLNREAQETLDEFLELLPDALDVYDLQSRLLCEEEKYDEALAKLQPGMERFPDDTRLTMCKLYILVQAERAEEAKALITELKESGKCEGFRKTIAMHEAQINANAADAEGIEKSLLWALEESKDDPELLYILLSLYIGKLKYEDILKTADQILKLENISPSVSASARFYKAMAMKELGKGGSQTAEFRKMSTDFRKLTIQNPGLSDLYMLRILCHCELGEYDKALALADYLEKIAPDSADGHTYRHIIYRQMGNEEMSEKELAEARKVNPDLLG